MTLNDIVCNGRLKVVIRIADIFVGPIGLSYLSVGVRDLKYEHRGLMKSFLLCLLL